MADTIEVEVKRKSEGFQCQMCNAKWIPKSVARPPIRCANPECRSRKWDAAKYPNATPPDGQRPKKSRVQVLC
jgi:hypothetical protein